MGVIYKPVPTTKTHHEAHSHRFYRPHVPRPCLFGPCPYPRGCWFHRCCPFHRSCLWHYHWNSSSTCWTQETRFGWNPYCWTKCLSFENWRSSRCVNQIPSEDLITEHFEF